MAKRSAAMTSVDFRHARAALGHATQQPVAVQVRHLPYPYEAALAICSDLDLTPDKQAYLAVARYLNTTASTAMGPGVGLEVGNSLYFDMPPDQFAYWTTDDAGREMFRTLIHSGHIDCLHSYGDLARTRADVQRNLDELQRHDCKLSVWVDHSKAPTNFGPDIMQGSGDVVGSAAYHADLTLAYGIRYVWRGRTTGVNGQNAPINAKALGHMLDARHPIASTRTMAKEAVKISLGRSGHPRWEMYAANDVCRPSKLRDGRPIWEFLRSNPFWNGSGKGDTADGIGDVLTRRMLDGLVRRRGICVLYTHLGKVRDRQCPPPESARNAFRRLAEYQERGSVFVTMTQRLLQFMTVRDALQFRAERDGDVTVISIGDVNDAVFGTRPPTDDELGGMSFIVPGRGAVRIQRESGEAIASTPHVGDDSTTASIPWRRLTFPASV